MAQHSFREVNCLLSLSLRVDKVMKTSSSSQPKKLSLYNFVV